MGRIGFDMLERGRHMNESAASIFGAANCSAPAAPARLLGEDPNAAFDGQVSWEDGACGSLLQVRSAAGSGTVELVEAFPGVDVLFNDFHMGRCASGFTTSSEVLCVDWCEEGRIEQPMPGGAYAYVAPGDLKLDDRTRHTGTFTMPTGRYRGVTVSFELPAAQKSVDRALDGFPADIAELRERFCHEGRPLLLRGCAGAAGIFRALAAAPAATRRSWCQIKALELLLFLQGLEPLPRGGNLPYYPRSQVERVKAACAAMTVDLSRAMTVEEAARAAGMPQTAFKACFKGVYGTSPAAYVRSLRMERAARLLQETRMSVADIGACVGYASPSKFAAAFKAERGVAPSAYRRA